MDVKNSVNELIKMSVVNVEASSNVEGLPITSNVVHTTSYASTSLEFGSDETSETNLSSINNILYVGDENKEIMKFKLENGGENDKDVVLKSVRLR